MLTTTPHPHIHIVSFPLLHRPKAPNSSFIEHVEDNANHFTSPPSATVSADRFGLYNQPDHSHEPSSDSELVKRLKGLIKNIVS
ncbi:hypothetical protein CMV_019986 [Castanea mollissima]|uniref:Uncharacterized protein n=1 Tax=Castanea mollissima TaxID=60419 RepID=A0A8J4QNY2_9ROSI|nr:hypothetical protein CMV_019986 [Castanea mollissima]